MKSERHEKSHKLPLKTGQSEKNESFSRRERRGKLSLDAFLKVLGVAGIYRSGRRLVTLVLCAALLSQLVACSSLAKSPAIAPEEESRALAAAASEAVTEEGAEVPADEAAADALTEEKYAAVSESEVTDREESEGSAGTGPDSQSRKPESEPHGIVEIGIAPGTESTAGSVGEENSGSVTGTKEGRDESNDGTDSTAASAVGGLIDFFRDSFGTDAQEEETEDAASTYISWVSCRIEGTYVVLTGKVEGDFSPANIGPDADDPYFYLIELEPYEDDVSSHQMSAFSEKSTDVSFRLSLRSGTSGDRLYHKFVACVRDGDDYRAVSDYICITNPEAAASVTTAYQTPITKKGLLIELSQVSDAFSLGVSNVIVNIPMDDLLGEGIDYVYDGETYHFSSEVVAVYDRTISTFSNKDMNVHAILLNRYDGGTPELFYDGVTGKEKGALYYAFNAADEVGYKYIKAIASFLASRYSGTDPDHGLVQNWIIGNEINNQQWNYIGPMDIEEYVHEYLRSFRVFYAAIKSCFADARVYFSLDNNWNQGNDDRLTYTARDILTLIAEDISAHGDIDWGLGYHPYSVPTNEPEFWDDFDTGLVDMSVDSPVVNFANLQVLTDFMQQDFMLDTGGSVRHIVLSEQGFTSESASRGTVEELQAAAFAYAYYIADSNRYIDAFILSRQIDAPSETKVSLAFGLWTTDATQDVNITPSRKKYIWNVFKNIDRKATTLEYSEFAKSIIGIEHWYDIIPNFKWRSQEKLK